MNGRTTRLLVGFGVIVVVFLPFIRGRIYASSFAVTYDAGFLGNTTDAATDKGSVASSGTWVITDEIVIIANTTFTHEGNIIIRGTGQLMLENATLNLQQITSWQFSIRLQDSAVLSLTNSRLKTVYPYRVALSGEAVILAQAMSAPLVALHTESTMTSICTNTSFLEVNVGAVSEVIFDTCQTERIVAAEQSHVYLNNSDVEILRCYDQSTADIQESVVGAAHCDGNSIVTFANSTLGHSWCWFSSNFSAQKCDITTLQYYDSAIVSVFDSSIDSLIGAGSEAIILDSLSIREVTLTGEANATLIRCVSENIFCDWYSTLRFINGSCSRIESLDWADVSVIGAPTVICNITTYGAYADSSSQISWTAFNTIELGHRTRTWINDSSAYSIQNWAYGGISPLHMTRCVIDWELRLAWGVQGIIMNSTVDNVLVYGDSSLNASGCEFQAIMIGDVDDALIQDCRIGGLFPAGDAHILVVSSNVSCGIRPGQGTSSVFDSLPVGLVSHWNALDSGAIQGLMWNLTITESIIDWHAILRYDSQVEFRNCILSRLACDETCTVLATNITIDEMVVTRNSDVTVSNGTINDLDCGLWSTSSFTNTLISDVFTIGESKASFYNCTITSSLAGGASSPYFEGCEIGWHKASGESSSMIQGCLLGNFSSYDASINYCYTTTVLDLLACNHVSVLTLSECTITSVSAGETAAAQFYNCSIGSIMTTAYAEFLCTESIIDELECNDASIVVLSGNLTGLTWYSVTDSSVVIRQLEVIVRDSGGQQIDGALVEVYNSENVLLVQSWTSSDGSAKFEISFKAANASLMQIFTLNISKDGCTYDGQFTIMDSIPIRVVIESGLPSAAAQKSGCNFNAQPDEPGISDASERWPYEAPSTENQCHIADESWESLTGLVLLSVIEMILVVQSGAVSLVMQIWPVYFLHRKGVKATSIAIMKKYAHRIREV